MTDRAVERQFWALAVLLGVFCGLVTIRAGRAAGFIDDDLANLGLGKRYGFGVGTFFGPAAARDHIQPAAAALNKFVSLTGPHWWLAQLLSALLVAVLVVAVAAMVRLLTDSAYLSLFVAFAVGCSVVIGRIALWWTAASLSLPMLVCAAAAVILSLKWWRSRSPLLLAGVVLMQVMADSFSDRALILPLIVWGVLVLGPPPGGSLGIRMRERTRSAFVILVTLVAVAALHVAATLILTRSSTSTGFSDAAGLSALSWVETFANWWARGVAGVLTNEIVPAGGSPIAGGRTSLIFVAGCLVLAGLIALTVRRRLALAAWGAFAVLTTVSCFLFAIGRIGTQGPVGISTVPRYQDLTLLALAVFAPIAWTLSGRPRPPIRGIVGTLAVAAICLAWFLQLRSGIRDSLARPIAAAKYARNLQESLDDSERSGTQVTVIDDRVPDYVMFRVPQTGSFSWLSAATKVLAPDAPDPDFGSRRGEPWTVDIEGVAAPAALSNTANMKKGPRCVSTSRDSRWLEGSRRITVPVSRRAFLSGRPVVLEVELADSEREGEIGVLSLLPAKGVLPTQTFSLAARPEGFRALLQAGTPQAALDLWGGASTCVVAASTAELRK